MIELLEAFANFLILPSAAFGLLIGAGIGVILSFIFIGEINYIAVSACAVCGSLLNVMLFKWIDRKSK